MSDKIELTGAEKKALNNILSYNDRHLKTLKMFSLLFYANAVFIMLYYPYSKGFSPVSFAISFPFAFAFIMLGTSLKVQCKLYRIIQHLRAGSERETKQSITKESS